jgi:myo-inositol-1(or 4)-monophosphatase
MDLERHLRVAQAAAARAGAQLRQVDRRSIRLSYKADGGSVSRADIAAQEACVGMLVDFDPGYAVVSEEDLHRAGTTDRTWVVDPLDGTTNFVRGLPDYAVAIALTIEGSTALSVIHLPETATTYFAVRGQGAFRDGRRLEVAAPPSGRPLAGTGFGTAGVVRERQTTIADRLLRAGFDIREPGSASIGLCRVAEGAYDGYLEFGIGVWDVLPGALVVAEAGGVVSNWNGAPLERAPNDVVAATPATHEVLLRVGGGAVPVSGVASSGGAS